MQWFFLVLEIGLLFHLGLIVFACTVLSYAAQALRQPLVLAYIFTGVLLGPIGLGGAGFSIAGIPIGIKSIEEVLVFSELGIAFLLFGIGVETNFSKLLGLGKTLLLGGFLQIALTILAVFVSTYYLGFLSFEQSILLGVILAQSSTAIVVKILSDRHEIGTVHAKLLIGFLLVQDLFVIISLPFLKNFQAIYSLELVGPILAQGILLLMIAFFLNKSVYPKLFQYGSSSDELLFLASIASFFVFIIVATVLDFSIAIAAFIAGVTISNLPYNIEVFHKIKGLRDFFSTIFFVALGMQINLSFTQFPIPMVFLLLATVFVLKPLLFFAITLFSGYGARIAIMVGLSLAQVSEFSFIIASQGREILDRTAGLYSLIILVITVSLALTPYLMRNSNSLAEFFKKKIHRLSPFLRSTRFSKKIVQLQEGPQGFFEHIIIVGAGAIGFAVAKSLEKDFQVIVVDHELEAVLRCRKHGITAIYGSADNFEIMYNAGISKARVLVLALPDSSSAALLAQFAKKENPKITVFGRAHHYSQALHLYESGVDYVVMTHVIGGKVFLENILEFISREQALNIEKFSGEYADFVKKKALEESKRLGVEHFKNF